MFERTLNICMQYRIRYLQAFPKLGSLNDETATLANQLKF